MKTKTLIPLIMGVVVGGAAIKMVVDAINTAEGAGRADMTQCVVAQMDFDFAAEMTPRTFSNKRIWYRRWLHKLLASWPARLGLEIKSAALPEWATTDW